MNAILKALRKLISHRIFILFLIILGMFYILYSRIFDLQIVQGEKLDKEFSLSILKERELEGQRGNIYDRNGYPLAENVIAYNVLLDGSIKVDNINQMSLDLSNIIKKGGNVLVNALPIGLNQDGNIVFTQTDAQVTKFKKNVFLGGASGELSDEEKAMTANDVYVYLRDELFDIPTDTYSDSDILTIFNIRYPLWLNRYIQYKLSTIAVNISSETLARIEENIVKFPGVSIVEDPLRKYNNANYFSHIIGYTGLIDAETLEELKPQGYNATDIVGKIGVEKQMEVYLRGQNGSQTVEVDNLGRTMQILNTVEPKVGKDVYLTIDKDLQIKAYDMLEKELAYQLQSTLSMKGSNKLNEDDGVTLMRDVFTSLFNSELISIKSLEVSTADQRQNNIYNTFLQASGQLKTHMDYQLSNNGVYPSNDDINYYKLFLSELNKEGYLNSDYKNNDLYNQMLDLKATFKELLEDYISKGLLLIPSNSNTQNLSTYDQIKALILNSYMNYFDLKKELYKELATKEAFSYSDLCLTLIEQRVVSATDSEVKNIRSGKLGSVSFMKEKISNLEITPQQLALDPCSGSIVVTDVNTGEVLALVSYPSYDNNKLVNDFDYNYYSSLLNDATTPLFPRATQGKTAPGSTFKMVSAIAALEEGVVKPKETVVDLGIFTKVFPPAKCWIYSYGSTHGAVSVATALEVSCNYFYYEMGYRLATDDSGSYIAIRGINTLDKYAKLLGLGEKTGIEIGESSATLPTEDPVRSAIGQTTNAYTPVQLARYVSTVANGGTSYELNVIDKIQDNEGHVFFEKEPAIQNQNNFSPINIKTVQQGMFLVTTGSQGTARSIFNGFPIKVAAKTGTAQQALNRPDHGVFVGYAPYDKPEIAVSVVIPFGYGSNIPTIIGRDVIAAYYELNDEKAHENTSYYHMLDE